MKRDSIIGYFSMALLQANNIPTLLGDKIMLSPITPALTIIGLSGYLFFSIKNRIVLYTIGNSIGIIFSAILLYRILS